MLIHHSHKLINYMSYHHLHEPMQSACKRFHSIETALTLVHKRHHVDHGKARYLLDLSTAFGTIDHNVLPARVEELLGVKDVPLKWFTSYLSGRTQRFHINNQFSQPHELMSGVPQGSYLVPCCF